MLAEQISFAFKTKHSFSQTNSCIHLSVRCPLAEMVCLRSCVLNSSGFQNKGTKNYVTGENT